jgi:hypothetical protein
MFPFAFVPTEFLVKTSSESLSIEKNIVLKEITFLYGEKDSPRKKRKNIGEGFPKVQKNKRVFNLSFFVLRGLLF